MTLILTKSKTVLSIPALQRIVLKSIYLPKNMTLLDEAQMQHSIVSWRENLDMKKNYKIMTAVDEENLIALEEMAWLIKENQEGRLDNRKKLFKDRGIDYQKFHRLPGSVSEEDRARAQNDLEKLMAEKPEEYL